MSWANVDLRQGRMRDYSARLRQAYELNAGNAHVMRAIGQVDAEGLERLGLKLFPELFGRYHLGTVAACDPPFNRPASICSTSGDLFS